MAFEESTFSSNLFTLLSLHSMTLTHVVCFDSHSSLEKSFLVFRLAVVVALFRADISHSSLQLSQKKCLKCSSVFWFVLFMNPLSVDYAKNAVISRLLNLIWQLGALKFSSLWLREKEEIVKVVRKWFELKFPPNFGEKKRGIK